MENYIVLLTGLHHLHTVKAELNNIKRLRLQQSKAERADMEADGVEVHVFKLDVSILFSCFATTSQEQTVTHFPVTTVQTKWHSQRRSWQNHTNQNQNHTIKQKTHSRPKSSLLVCILYDTCIILLINW